MPSCNCFIGHGVMEHPPGPRVQRDECKALTCFSAGNPARAREWALLLFVRGEDHGRRPPTLPRCCSTCHSVAVSFTDHGRPESDALTSSAWPEHEWCSRVALSEREHPSSTTPFLRCTVCWGEGCRLSVTRRTSGDADVAGPRQVYRTELICPDRVWPAVCRLFSLKGTSDASDLHS